MFQRLILILLLSPVCAQLHAFTVTFRLQMVGVSGYTTPEVNGTFNEWCGQCNPMSDANNDGIWETTIDLPAGYYEFKYSADNWSQQESLAVGSSCTATTGQFTNRTLQVNGNIVLPIVCWGLCSSCTVHDVTFAVDMSTVTGFTTPYVSGTFNNWCGNCNAMSDPNNDGIWTATIALQTGFYEYKYSYNNWQGSENLPVGASCTTTNFGFTNRFIDVTQDIVLPVVCWGSCDTPGTGNGPLPTVQIALSGGTNPSCVLTDVSFTATTTNTTSTPVYQWYVDNIPVGLNQATYSNHQLTDGQSVTCSIVGGSGCGSSAVATSNAIVVLRENPVSPSITISASNGGNWCAGQEVTFTASAINGGSNPQYQWQVNGQNIGANGPVFTTSNLQSGQQVQCLLTSNAACQQTPWNMIWNDEFNGSTLDLTKWTPETGATGWGNNEWQNYTNTANNIQFSDGQLHIVARNDGPPGLQYTSARLITKNNFSFKYGRVSGRLQIPTGQGIWPAFWMLGANIDQVSWPACGEIDIMEHVNNEPKIHGTTHWNNNGWTSNSGHIDTSVGGYHEYMVEWDSLRVRFFMDGQIYHEHIISATNGSLDEFTKPFFLLLNVAIGGNWPGYPNATTTFPVSMDVDYVRVWQRNAPVGNTFTSNTIAIGGGTAQTWYLDNDGDGYGTSQNSTSSCVQPLGYAALSGDCNDNNASIHPLANETCNGIDDNCNAQTDENFSDTDNDNIADCMDSDADGDGWLNDLDCSPLDPSVWEVVAVHADEDGDGYGAGPMENICMGNTIPQGYSTLSSDCDDTNATVYPGSTAAPSIVSGPLAICGGQTATFAATTGAQNYIWELPGNTSGVSNTADMTIAFASSFLGGNLCVTPQYSCASAPTSCVALTALSSVAPYPGSIAGATLVCTDNSIYTYSIAPLNFVDDYVWSVPTNCTLISGQGSTSIAVSCNENFTTGNIQVYTTNCTGNSLTRILKINKRTLPGRPGAMTGLGIICPGTTQTYSVAASSGATSYLWTASNGITIVSGQGTTAVTVAFSNTFVSGGLSVYGVNCTGTGQDRYRAINRQPLPATPGLISGQSVGICGPMSQTYSIAPMTNVQSYDWQAPPNSTIVSGQGSTTVTVSFASNYTTGTLSVRAVNCSGASTIARNLLIKSVIAMPAALDGPSMSVCGGTTHTYTAQSVLGATHYIWTVPSGATINGANNGTSISVTFPTPFSTGTITVRAATSCFTSLAKSLSVGSILPQPGAISGTSAGLCGGCTYTFSIAAVIGATNYNWNVPAGWSIINNWGTGIEVVLPIAGISTSTLSVTAQNACGNSPIRILNVSGNLTNSMPQEESDPSDIEDWNELSLMENEQLVLRAFPNPTRGDLHLEWPIASEQLPLIYFVDATGRQIILPIEQIAHTGTGCIVDMEALSSGIYTLQLVWKTKHVHLRIVKE
jgi:beta-glucanase (GH16 family)